MKYFKCGNCQKAYKIDESKVQSSIVIVECSDCKAKNSVRFGPILVAQSANGVKQFSLKLGENMIGRISDKATAGILINDEYVSRNHASVFLEEKDGKLFFFIADNNSLNGTFNQKKSRLKPGLKYPLTPKDYYIAGLTKLHLKFN
ncbi:MAG: FHA domain-containing protein [Flavobacteriales bacterium]|jgi:hypothetical protein